MVEFTFNLTDDAFNRLAELKEQETEPEYRNMTFNEYAAEILEQVIWTRYTNLRQSITDLPF